MSSRFIQPDAGRVADTRLTRFFIGGNAGGAIAALTLIGAFLGGGGKVLPSLMFWIMAAFVAGLFGGLVPAYPVDAGTHRG